MADTIGGNKRIIAVAVVFKTVVADSAVVFETVMDVSANNHRQLQQTSTLPTPTLPTPTAPTTAAPTTATPMTAATTTDTDTYSNSNHIIDSRQWLPTSIDNLTSPIESKVEYAISIATDDNGSQRQWQPTTTLATNDNSGNRRRQWQPTTTVASDDDSSIQRRQ